MKVKEVICAAGRSGYMHRDLLAIKSGKAKANGSLYEGAPMSPGFTSTRSWSKEPASSWARATGAVTLPTSRDSPATRHIVRMHVLKSRICRPMPILLRVV